MSDRIARRNRGYRGHTPVRHGARDWRCRCGVSLSDRHVGDGRAGARYSMRFHRADIYLGNVPR